MNFGKESEYLEFKETTGEMEEALIDIGAILNKHGHGTLYFGVKNNGDVVSINKFTIVDSTIRDISRNIFEAIKPQIFPVIEKLEDENVVKVSFDGNQRPYSVKGKYFIRVADESRDIPPHQLVDMIMKLNVLNWERHISDATIDDVDEESLKKFHKKATECKRMPEMEYDRIAILDKLSLLDRDGFHLNNAGKYLFSNKEPIQLKLAVFATDEKRTFIDINPVFGNIFVLIDKAESYIKEHISWKVEINGFDRKDIPEIPVDALREIIVNSFAHADYLGMSTNEIDIHPSKVAIYNPGSFPDDFKPEDYVNNNLPSKIRNELISNILYKCKFIESWGTGFKKTYSFCSTANVICDYEKEVDGFWFFFYRKNVTNVTKNVTNVTNQLSELEKIVLAAIELNKTITIDQLAKKCSRTKRTVQRILNEMKDKKIIVRVGQSRNGYWEVLHKS